MRAALAPLAAVLALAGCGRRGEPAPSPPTATDAGAAPVDAGPPPLDAAFEDAAVPLSPEEAAARADRTTGLPGGGPPAVISEILIVMMATGRAERRPLVAPTAGAWEVELGERDRLTRRCGLEAGKFLDDNLGRLADRQLAGRGAIACDNRYAATAAAPPEPRAVLGRHMLCVSPSAGADDGSYALLFVPDDERGARLLAAVTAAPGAPLERAWPLLAKALARPSKPCP